MSKQKNARNEQASEVVNEVVNESANSEATNANENTNTSAGETDEPMTPEQTKASQILKARLPKLAEYGLNFEKRTGSFFKATLVNVLDADGNEVIEGGQVKQKISRLVVPTEGEDGEVLPEYVDCKEEIAIKRSAALVLGYDENIAKIDAKVADAQKVIDELNAEKSELVETVTEKMTSVMGYELPERSTAVRENLTVKLTKVNENLTKAQSQLEAMRNMLVAAGFTEEQINEQLGQ